MSSISIGSSSSFFGVAVRGGLFASLGNSFSVGDKDFYSGSCTGPSFVLNWNRSSSSFWSLNYTELSDGSGFKMIFTGSRIADFVGMFTEVRLRH